MKKLVYLSAFLLIAATTISCSKEDPDDNTNTPGPLFLQAKSVITSGCAVSGCHTASASAGGLNFESNDQIVASANRINARAVVEGTMPPTAPLSADSKAKITAWINAGAKITD